MNPSLQEKKTRLIDVLKRFDHLTVALSGGVDSSLLLAEAHAVLGINVMAVTARSPIHPDRELGDARQIVAELGVKHLIIDSGEMHLSEFLANTKERCYICKKAVFGQLLERVRSLGYRHLAHGANMDDLGDYRPGLQAARELGISAPLMDAGLTKSDIRELARNRGLFVWDKPAMACIATRFPYGTPIEPEKVEQVKQAESVLREAGMIHCRVRHHGEVARIEVDQEQLQKIVTDPLRSELVSSLRALGFLHISVDLEGYVTGSMNRVLDDDHTR